MRQFVLKNKGSGPLRLIEEPDTSPPPSGPSPSGPSPTAEPAAAGPGNARADHRGAESRGAAGPRPGNRGQARPEPPGPGSVTADASPAGGPHPTEAAPHPTPTKSRKRGERCYVVSYDGQYIGFFEADDVLTPREAFLYVARELASRAPFDPEKLSLHKPVLIRSARPPRGTTFVRGRLARVEGLDAAAPSPAPASAAAASTAEPSASSTRADAPEADNATTAAPAGRASARPVFIDDPVVCLDEPAFADPVV